MRLKRPRKASLTKRHGPADFITLTPEALGELILAESRESQFAGLFYGAFLLRPACLRIPYRPTAPYRERRFARTSR